MQDADSSVGSPLWRSLNQVKNVIKGIEGEERSFNPPFLVWFTNRPLYQGTGSIFPKAENLHP